MNHVEVDLAGVTGPPANRALYGITDAGAFRRGGIGVVYEAVLLADRFDVPAGTKVGLKLLTGLDADRFAKLSQRGPLLRQHPHPLMARHVESFVGPPLSLGPVEEEDCNLFFSAHEWVEGRSLNEHMADASADQILAWVADVAAALDHLHSISGGGFAHRDVHARNVIVGPDNRARLIDYDAVLWGEASDTVLTSLQSAPRPLELVGTPAAQAHDRAMLALTLLRALARDTEGAAPVADVAHRALEVLTASTGERSVADALVAGLVDAVRHPPSRAGDLVDAACALLTSRRRTGRLGRLLGREPRLQTDVAVARLSAAGTGRPRSRWRVVANLATALVLVVVSVAGAYVVWGPDAPRAKGALGELEPAAHVVLTASAVSAGLGSTCLVRSADASVWCLGQAEEYDAHASFGPQPVFLREGARATRVASNIGRGCAITVRHLLWCWGANDQGQAGVGLDPEQEPGYATVQGATQVGLHEVTQVSIGSNSTCAIARTDGGLHGVYCWGESIGFAVPDDDEPASADAGYLTLPAEVPSLTGATDVSTNGGSACAVVAGSVFCWGRGEIPPGSEDAAYPSRIEGVPSNVGSIVVGSATTCAVTRDFRLYCWGLPIWEGSIAGAVDAVTPERMDMFGQVRQVALGSEHMCALTRSGVVSCAGDNLDGQLGNGIRDAVDGPVRVPVADARLVVAGGSHTCAVTTDDAVKCWGDNSSGESGGRDDAVHSSPVEVELAVPDPSWTITAQGFGPLRVGMSGRSAAATEMIDRVAGDTCGNKWEDSPGLGLAGVYTEFRDDKPGDLDYVVALDPRLDRPDVAGELPLIGTPEGIYPGSPLTDLRSAYGDRLHRGEFAGTGEPFTGYVLFDGGGALVFQMHGDDATRVESIMATRGTDMDNLVIPVGGC